MRPLLDCRQRGPRHVCYPLSTSATSSNGLNFGARPPHSEMTPIGTVRDRRRETRTAEGASGAPESVTTMSSQTPTERPTAPQRTDPHGRTWWGSRTRRRHVLGQTTALLSVFQRIAHQEAFAKWAPDAPTGGHLQWTHGDTVVIVESKIKNGSTTTQGDRQCLTRLRIPQYSTRLPQ
jgi:hypothetical protein